MNKKIFLSHKGADKPLVRKYKMILEEIGFTPWIDEEAMPAGTSLDRGILKGFKESCAAIFFITPNFKDETFLQTEIDYAMIQKREKKDKFSIITLVFSEITVDDQGEETTSKGVVPDILKTYVWKEPEDNVSGIIDVLKALPIEVKEISWK